MRLAGCAPGARDGFRLRGLGGGSHGRIPVEDATATVAGEHLALAELVPHLGPNAHAAACALLIINACDARSAGRVDAVKPSEPFGFDKRPQRFPLSSESGELGGELLLAEADACAGLVERGRHGFNLNACLGQDGFLGFGALEAGEFFILEAICLRGFKCDLVLDGGSLFGSLYRVELGFKAGAFLAMLCDLALEPSTQRFLATERAGSFSGDVLGGPECGLSVGELSRKRTHLIGEAHVLKFDGLKLYEIFNELLHLCQEGYGIGLINENERSRPKSG